MPDAASDPETQQRVGPPAQTGWRRSLGSFGGFTLISGIVLAAVLVLLLTAAATFRAVTAPAPLLGEPVHYHSSDHIPSGSLESKPGLTPAGGRHYRGTVEVGIYPEPVSEGNSIHSLEHGIVWITYHPDQLSDAELQTLEGIAADFPVDTILSPRLENSLPIIIVSWERRLTQTHLDEQALRDFISTNRNRSPEPGVR